MGANVMTEMTQAELVEHWTHGYNLWVAMLQGRKDVQIYADTPCAGFWRKQIKERDAKGNNKRVGWTAVAIFMNRGVMTGRVNGEDLTDDALETLWSYCSKHPITEEVWRAVVEQGEPWPDAPSTKI